MLIHQTFISLLRGRRCARGVGSLVETAGRGSPCLPRGRGRRPAAACRLIARLLDPRCDWAGRGRGEPARPAERASDAPVAVAWMLPHVGPRDPLMCDTVRMLAARTRSETSLCA